MLQPDGGSGAMTTSAPTRRALLALSAAGAGLLFIRTANGQETDDRGNVPPADGGQIDPVTGKVCRPMCAEDMSPCDPPVMKAREGRCSSPSAGFVG